jgi:PEP-CTERM motif
MRRMVMIAAALLAAGPAFAGNSWDAALQARDFNGDGVADAYFDIAQNITWLKDANYALAQNYPPALRPPGCLYFACPFTPGTMTFSDATEWVAALDVAGTTGWRLPRAVVALDPFGYRALCTYIFCRFDQGELANLSKYGIDIGTGPFANIQPSMWINHVSPAGYPALPGTSPGGPGLVGISDPRGIGFLFTQTIGTAMGAWAVHDGDVGVALAVPEPSSSALILGGLVLVGAVARRRRIRQ